VEERATGRLRALTRARSVLITAFAVYYSSHLAHHVQLVLLQAR
jgi:hypothetical protein